MEDVVIIKKLKKVFPDGDGKLVVFNGLDLTFRSNEITAILGPSGCGKTTLLRMIASLDQPTSGEIGFKNRAHKLGMIFQQYTAFPWLTVESNVAFGLKMKGYSEAKRKEIIAYWLHETGLRKFRTYYPNQLSGGMKQRLAFARCLALEPTVVLMDEPFGSLDEISRARMVEFSVQLLSSLGKTTIFVTHNIREAMQLADRVVVLSQMPASVAMDIPIQLGRPRTETDLWSDETHKMDRSIRQLLK